MSSIIIKGVQTPSECGYCPLCRYFSSVGATICMVTQATLAEDYKTIRFDGRHKECPLVELPEKHGRLVDVDEIHATMLDRLDQTTFEYALSTAPTIVEAEGADGE